MMKALQQTFAMVGINFAAISISMLPQLEQWLRIASLVGAIVYSFLQIVRMLKRWREN